MLLCCPSTLCPDETALLLECCEHGLVDTVAAIVGRGRIVAADIDQAFVVAATHGHVSILEYLRDKTTGGAHHIPDRMTGDTPCVAAARNGHLAAVQTLVLFGHHPDVRSESGLTALAAAVDGNREDVVVWLLEHAQSNVNAIDHARNSILHIAASVGNPAIVHLILAAGATTNTLNSKVRHGDGSAGVLVQPCL